MAGPTLGREVSDVRKGQREPAHEKLDLLDE